MPFSSTHANNSKSKLPEQTKSIEFGGGPPSGDIDNDLHGHFKVKLKHFKWKCLILTLESERE